MIKSAEEIAEFLPPERAAFDSNEVTQAAITMLIQIMGYAARDVSGDVRRAHPDITWRVMANRSKRYLRRYWEIELDDVWNVARQYPAMLPQIKAILASLPENT